MYGSDARNGLSTRDNNDFFARANVAQHRGEVPVSVGGGDGFHKLLPDFNVVPNATFLHRFVASGLDGDPLISGTTSAK